MRPRAEIPIFLSVKRVVILACNISRAPSARFQGVAHSRNYRAHKGPLSAVTSKELSITFLEPMSHLQQLPEAPSMLVLMSQSKTCAPPSVPHSLSVML